MVKTMGGRSAPRACGRLRARKRMHRSEDWDVTPGLSEPVQQAVDQAVVLVESSIVKPILAISPSWRDEPSNRVLVREEPTMRVLETLAGAVIAVFSVVILLVGSIFAVGSMGKYIRNKSM